MVYNDLLGAASGLFSISGAGPSLVTAGAQNLSDLLAAAAGMDELSREHYSPRMAFSGAEQAQAALAQTAAANPALAGMLRQALAQRMVNQGLIVNHTQPTKAREFPLGFESALPVGPGATSSITSRPQVPFRGERLIVPSDIAGSFTLLDLRVGKNSQFSSSGAVPARTFQENAVGIRLQLDTAQISQDITINVQNIGGAPQTFRASLIGSALDG
jgi:hypothetical protein